MRIDYSTRRQVSVNRPKRNPFRPLLLMTLVGGAVLFGLGVATGWLIFSTGRQSAASPAQSAVAKAPAPAQPVKAATAPRQQEGGETPQFTFYDSLPKGDKELIGSGLNPTRDSVPTAAAKAPQQTPSADAQPKSPKPQKPASPQPAAGMNSRLTDSEMSSHGGNKGTAPGKAVPASQKPAGKATTYTVQLASYRDRKEAEELKAKWAKNGYSVRVIETSAPGGGTLYRVRIGNRMSQEAASQLSGKIGGGAISVPEQEKK
jgi:cell division septation protein DedD